VPLQGIFAVRSLMGAGVTELRRLSWKRLDIPVRLTSRSCIETIWDRPADSVMNEMKRTCAEHL
jgi:hypothetical protein